MGVLCDESQPQQDQVRSEDKEGAGQGTALKNSCRDDETHDWPVGASAPSSDVSVGFKYKVAKAKWCIDRHKNLV